MQVRRDTRRTATTGSKRSFQPTSQWALIPVSFHSVSCEKDDMLTIPVLPMVTNGTCHTSCVPELPESQWLRPPFRVRGNHGDSGKQDVLQLYDLSVKVEAAGWRSLNVNTWSNEQKHFVTERLNQYKSYSNN